MFLFTFVFLALTVSSVQAQELPANHPRNAEFRDHFQKVVKANPTVSDFEKMQPGAAYFLPLGNTDALETGDTKGIWGREFRKFYGFH